MMQTNVLCIWDVREELQNFLRKELGNIEGLTSVETMINLKITKATFTYLASTDFNPTE